MITLTPDAAAQVVAGTPPKPAGHAPGTHVMLWSQSQCALHIEPMDAMLSTNRQAYADDRRIDYVPLFIGTDEDCRAIAASVRGTMHTRQDARREAVQA
ncbi:hypothetical protein [Pseudorhodoferax soli]|uniref:Uncharacterized protein n=1 Tax=Pseudorhodoferax soli TaxID=545864 RepID=A0A368Y280_9BURK|nr:hypothetical protein [Pseudorhodoferax soli]RCW73829.1 hypothetical protein DES41_102143 [Pseudorhodoferax soli]